MAGQLKTRHQALRAPAGLPGQNNLSKFRVKYVKIKRLPDLFGARSGRSFRPSGASCRLQGFSAMGGQENWFWVKSRIFIFVYASLSVFLWVSPLMPCYGYSKIKGNDTPAP
jgi:hypothetical protein